MNEEILQQLRENLSALHTGELRPAGDPRGPENLPLSLTRRHCSPHARLKHAMATHALEMNPANPVTALTGKGVHPPDMAWRTSAATLHEQLGPRGGLFNMNCNMQFAGDSRRVVGLDTLTVAGYGERGTLNNATLREAATELTGLDAKTASRLFDGPADIGEGRMFIRPDEAQEAIRNLVQGTHPDRIWEHLDRDAIGKQVEALQTLRNGMNGLGSGSIHETAEIDPSTAVERGVRIGENVTVGAHCHIQSGTEIEADARIEAGTFIQENSRIGRGAHIMSGCRLGPETTVLPHDVIGTDARIGIDRMECGRPDEPGEQDGYAGVPVHTVDIGPAGPVSMPDMPGLRWDPAYRTVMLESQEPGTILLTGPGAANVVRSGGGRGDAIRTGAGSGHAYRTGRGDGNARRSGRGDGDALRTASGEGDATRAGQGEGTAQRQGGGNGCALRSGAGNGRAERKGSGPGDAVRSGDGAGNAVHEGSGRGNAERHGKGQGNAIRKGGGGGNAYRTGDGAGNAERADEGHGDAIRSDAGYGNAVNQSAQLHADAIRDGQGAGHAVRSTAGSGRALRTGQGAGSAINTTGGKEHAPAATRDGAHDAGTGAELLG